MDSEFSGTITASELCSIADITPVTLRSWRARWKDRGLNILPEAEGWSRYTFLQAMQVTLIADLTYLGLHPANTAGTEDIAIHLAGLYGFQDDTAFLVISTGNLGRIIPTSPRGQPAPSRDEGTKVYVPGQTYSDIVRGRDLGQFLADPDKFVSVVCNLSLLEERVGKAWKMFKGA